jgi:hypothetical protein
VLDGVVVAGAGVVVVSVDAVVDLVDLLQPTSATPARALAIKSVFFIIEVELRGD